MTSRKSGLTKLLIVCAGLFVVALSACGGTTEDTSEQIPQDAPKVASENAQDGASQDASQDASEVARENTAGNVLESEHGGAPDDSVEYSLDAERAVQRYLEETANDPKAVGGWVKLSEAYLWLAADTGDLDQIENAEMAVGTALELAPVDVDALNQLSRVRSAQHDYEEVLHVQHESIYHGHLIAESWGIAGDAYMDLGRYRSADSCYYTMFELKPDFGTFVRVARRMFDIGDFDEAVSHAMSAVDTVWNPRDSSKRALADAYVLLGRMHLSRGDLDSARVFLDSSLHVFAGYVPALDHKARIYRLERDFAASREIYQRLTEMTRDPRYLSGLAWVYFEQGDEATVDSLLNVAAGIYEERFVTHPDVVRRDYVTFLLEWDWNRELAQQLAYQESRQRRDVDTYELLAWAYYQNENYNLAWSSIAMALRNEAKHPRIFYHAALIAKEAGKQNEFKTYSKKARELNPTCESMYGAF